jgi:hypothetical protein
MAIESVIAEIDSEIERLRQARKLLTTKRLVRPKRGRRTSAAIRKRMSTAQRKRWKALKEAKK